MSVSTGRTGAGLLKWAWLLPLYMLCSACGSGGPARAAVGRGARPPDVILISIDTLRADHVGCYGYERETTPHLDRLAQESVLYERAYTTMSWTLIAHMSMLTGLYPSQHKVWKDDAVLSSDVPTLAERLREAGYHTLGFYDSTAHWVDPEFGYERGFDRYVAHRNAEQAHEHMQAALAERPADQPLFLFVHLFDVHNAPLKKSGCQIYHPPAPFDRHFLEDARERLADINAKQWWLHDASSASDEQHEAVVALYDGGIRYVDQRIGSWLEEWRASGLYDQALILVTADHGEGLRQRANQYGGHGDAREEGLRVPFLMKLPKGELAGTRVAGPISQVDITPTILDLAGLPYDARLPGYSLLAGRPAAALVYAERDETQVLIRGKYKLIQSTQRKEVGAVYDLEADPEERSPIRARSPDEAQRELFHLVAEELRAAMQAERAGWFQPAASGLRVQPMDAALQKRMEELGYGGGEEPEDAEPASEEMIGPAPGDGER